MELKNIEVINFRKIKEKVDIKLNYETLIVGKNNTAKTSIFELLNKFLSTSEFKIEDFNFNLLKNEYIDNLYLEYSLITSIEEKNELISKFPYIEMNLNITVKDEDNISSIKELIYEFENNNEMIIKCMFSLDNLDKMIQEYNNYNSIFPNTDDKINFSKFFKKKFKSYYSKKYYSTKKDDDYMNEVSKDVIKSMFNIYTIFAQRNVDDNSETEKLTLSTAIWKFYQKKSKTKENSLDSEDQFKNAIEDIKDKMNNSYNEFFSDLTLNLNSNIINDDVNRKLEIVSDFDIENILKQNSKIKYFIGEDVELTEAYNGLGYSNLLYMFIQIEAFKFEMLSNDAVFNILLIEEPESHLHPQMQTVFLKKMNQALQDGEKIYKIITTHSSYILQSSDIESVIYFLNKNNEIKIKSLSNFMLEYSGLNDIIKKYFRINTCDLFFSDKVILVEGNSERMLLRSMIDKFDENITENKLGHQHISIFEVGGAYGYVFESLLKFLEIKCLIITDIDSVIGNHNKKTCCDISNEPLENKIETPYSIKTSNCNIKKWFRIENGSLYIKDIFENCQINDEGIKSIKISDELEIPMIIGESMITFQLPQNGQLKIGRTFEEQFILENSIWIKDNIQNLESLHSAINNSKNDDGSDCGLNFETITAELLTEYFYQIVDKLVKTSFAIDLLENSGWEIPSYINDGLVWFQR